MADGAPSRAEAGPLTLWYRQPARQWTEALPVGNGRLGAMVFGTLPEERLALNEDTFWSGVPYAPVNLDAASHLAAVRQRILAGDHVAAQELADGLMGVPLRLQAHQPLADLWRRGGRRCPPMHRARRSAGPEHPTCTVPRCGTGRAPSWCRARTS